MTLVRNAWTKLRNAFINAKKRRQTKSGQSATKVIPWKYDQEMSFILPYLESRSTLSNVENQDAELIINDEENSGDEDNVVSATPQEIIADNSADSTRSQNCINTETIGSVPLVVHSLQKKARLSSRDSSSNPALEMVRIMKQNAEARNERRNIANSKPKLDEIDMFYLSMAQTVKRLPAKD